MKMNKRMEEKLQAIRGYREMVEAGISVAFYRGWNALEESKNERIDFFDISESEVERVVENLREAGLTEFTVSDRSTALMDVIDGLVSEGCTLIGFDRVRSNHTSFGKSEPDLIPAMVFQLAD